MSHAFADAELNRWRPEIQAVACRQAGLRPPATIRRLIPEKPIADDVIKRALCNGEGQITDVALCSPTVAPTQVATAMERAGQAKRVLGGALGTAVLSPVYEATNEGCSYAIVPYRKPLTENRLKWVVQRQWVSRSVLSWLRNLTRKTARDPSAVELEANFRRPLAHLAEMKDVSPRMRAEAEAALDRLDRGLWKPKHVLMHNDLWRGNILTSQIDPGFVVIDWGGSRVHGYGVFDLLRVSDSLRVSVRRMRIELEEHCRLLGCDLDGARSHLVASLAELSTRLEEFPVERFVGLSHRSFDSLHDVVGV